MRRFLTDTLSTVNRLQHAFTGHVLLYHSTFSVVPGEIRRNLHNVTPEVLSQQLAWLKKYFDIVDVDELFGENIDVTGKVAITFDDAYQSVFSEALPIVEALDIPCTIFLNGASLSGKPFWRDKSRYLINQSLVDDFLTFCPSYAETHNLTTDNFYRASKLPRVNSAEFDGVVDEYMTNKGIQPNAVEYCVNNRQMLRDHPLITYGNHTYRHYVLSSLSDEQQEHEIGDNHRMLNELGLKVSRVFSIPFGGDADLNEATTRILDQYGYEGFLYSRGAINFGRAS